MVGDGGTTFNEVSGKLRATQPAVPVEGGAVVSLVVPDFVVVLGATGHQEMDVVFLIEGKGDVFHGSGDGSRLYSVDEVRLEVICDYRVDVSVVVSVNDGDDGIWRRGEGGWCSGLVLGPKPRSPTSGISVLSIRRDLVIVDGHTKLRCDGPDGTRCFRASGGSGRVGVGVIVVGSKCVRGGGEGVANVALVQIVGARANLHELADVEVGKSAPSSGLVIDVSRGKGGAGKSKVVEDHVDGLEGGWSRGGDCRSFRPPGVKRGGR